jgi:predicted phosphodiesterase
MRLAVISDIHSNLEALTKSLEVMETLSIDEIVCLGDVIGYGANPNECIDLVRRQCSIVLKGNHEDAVENISMTEYFTDDARSAIFWTRTQLTEKNLEYLTIFSLFMRRPAIRRNGTTFLMRPMRLMLSAAFQK